MKQKSLAVALMFAAIVGCAPAPAPVSTSTPTTPPPVQQVDTPPQNPSNTVGRLVVASYSLTQPDARYPDETQRQLTDSLLGDDIFNRNLSGAPGTEWVAWFQSNATLTFKFSGSKKVSRISLGLNRNDGAGIGLPTRVLINGRAFSVSPSSIQNAKRGFVPFNIDTTSDTITIVLERSDRNWLFVDEVLFEGI